MKDIPAPDTDKSSPAAGCLVPLIVLFGVGAIVVGAFIAMDGFVGRSPFGASPGISVVCAGLILLAAAVGLALLNHIRFEVACLRADFRNGTSKQDAAAPSNH